MCHVNNQQMANENEVRLDDDEGGWCMEITVEDVQVLKSVGHKKAPALDFIPREAIKDESMGKLLTKLFFLSHGDQSKYEKNETS